MADVGGKVNTDSWQYKAGTVVGVILDVPLLVAAGAPNGMALAPTLLSYFALKIGNGSVG